MTKVIVRKLLEDGTEQFFGVFTPQQADKFTAQELKDFPCRVIILMPADAAHAQELVTSGDNDNHKPASTPRRRMRKRRHD